VTGRFFENDADRQADTVRLNCVAPAVLARHFLPAMVKRGRGAVITISSVVAGQPTPYWATYSASKVFELYLGEALAYELRGSGVDSLVVMPGATKTEFQSVASVGEIPLSRTPEQVVETALDALGRRTWVVDGLANRIRFALVRLLPGRLVIGSAGRIMSRRLR
jgi:short-subunit dehydrogenase